MGYCDTCYNTGYIDCHCGGDLCICGDEEIECPSCGGGFFCDDPFAEDLEEGFDAGEWTETPKVVNVGDELHQVLADALAKNKSGNQ